MRHPAESEVADSSAKPSPALPSGRSRAHSGSSGRSSPDGAPTGGSPSRESGSSSRQDGNHAVPYRAVPAWAAPPEDRRRTGRPPMRRKEDSRPHTSRIPDGGRPDRRVHRSSRGTPPIQLPKSRAQDGGCPPGFPSTPPPGSSPTPVSADSRKRAASPPNGSCSRPLSREVPDTARNTVSAPDPAPARASGASLPDAAHRIPGSPALPRNTPQSPTGSPPFRIRSDP